MVMSRVCFECGRLNASEVRKCIYCGGPHRKNQVAGIPTNTRCVDCSERLLSHWRVCPSCGLVLKEITPPKPKPQKKQGRRLATLLVGLLLGCGALGAAAYLIYPEDTQRALEATHFNEIGLETLWGP